MRYLGYLILLLCVSAQSKSQTSDYCFTSKSNWTPVHNTACLFSMFSFSTGIGIAKGLNPSYTPLQSKVDNGEFESVDSAFTFTNKTGKMSGVTVLSLGFSKNAKLIIATIPYENDDATQARVVALIKTDGECQLLADGVYKKVKVKTETNEALYSITPDILETQIGGKKNQFNIIMYYKDGYMLKYITLGNTYIKI